MQKKGSNVAQGQKWALRLESEMAAAALPVLLISHQSLLLPKLQSFYLPLITFFSLSFHTTYFQEGDCQNWNYAEYARM